MGAGRQGRSVVADRNDIQTGMFRLKFLAGFRGQFDKFRPGFSNGTVITL
ncbi:MAG: hypothetical protein JWN14_1248 [Chthonomonadales bacterium]|nr:hypothetical protein [Chthonomonadales bacterium]